jgi:hypothetical protein
MATALSIGYNNRIDRREDRKQQQEFNLLHLGAPANHCWGRCGKSRAKCLKDSQYLMLSDRRLMKSQELRYSSWCQRIREGELYVRRAKFNQFNFK